MWARRASSSGVRIIGSSSVPNDPAQGDYAEWVTLPWLGDGDFPNALRRILCDRRIDAVFTTHAVVWHKLKELLPKMGIDVHLEGEQHWSSYLTAYREYRTVAELFEREPLEIAASSQCAPPLSRLQMTALVRQFQMTPGQCDYRKLQGLVEAVRRAPEGDIIEVGSLWGRSALALAYLSHQYRTGKLLCVDPWRNQEMLQGVPDIDAVCEELPIEDIFQAFLVNLAPFSGRVNYWRGDSSTAMPIYSKDRGFTTAEFGRTEYQGRIALLHIDGNHALKAVRADIAAWLPFVCAGSWIIFDDYIWPFGDGPQIAADEFCHTFVSGIRTRFVAGGALFVQANTELRTLLEAEPQPSQNFSFGLT